MPARIERDIVGIDGEGITLPDGRHIYTLLCAFDRRRQRWGYIQNWTDGLTTEDCLQFLLWTRCRRNGLRVGFFLNYDVALWLRDLTDAQKTAIWASGWLIWQGPSGRGYYLKYIPSKLFEIAEYDPERCGAPPFESYRWPKGLRRYTIYDVSGFSQTSFVKTLQEWDLDPGNVAAMKEKRSQFTAADAAQELQYCKAECDLLTQYVAKLDATFQDEGIWLNAFHGAGALAGYFLKEANVGAYLTRRRAECDPDLDAAIYGAYYGGRTEALRIGHLHSVYNYDINSAYPHACLRLPDLGTGEWRACDEYVPFAQYAIWYVRWVVDDHAAIRQGVAAPLAPFPFRRQRGIWYARRGAAWVHSAELSAALTCLGRTHIDVLRGWVYHPADAGRRPFDFVAALAERRVAYKNANDHRAVPYKLGLNSIYGKLAQHTIDDDKPPPYQDYYAAGFVTAATRARLLRMACADGHDGSDVVMFCTDGIFTLEPRSTYVGSGFGEFEYKGMAADMCLLHPGVWYSPSGIHRTRGYGATRARVSTHQGEQPLSYSHIAGEWDERGTAGSVAYHEARFIGLGGCVGRANFTDYATWPDVERVLRFAPARKWVREQMGDSLPLYLYDMMDRESEAYVPPRLRTDAQALDAAESVLQFWADLDQPDIAE